MKQTQRPNYRQERSDFEHYQSNTKRLLFYPFRIAFEKLKNAGKNSEAV